MSTPKTKEAQPIVAAWASWLGSPVPEPARSRVLARSGGLLAILAVIGYLTWRIYATLPSGGVDLAAAWVLISLEIFSLFSMVARTVALWNIDATAPEPLDKAPEGLRLVMFIPTYNEPRDVVLPTVAAACALEPAHETWVLDDGDRPWVQEMAETLGARYVSRPVHDHAKAGNINNALDILYAEDAAGIGGADIMAVLDCDHVPMPSFFLATLGWFADPEIALVQGPQAYYNTGAFDDDGFTGEQGMFFNVMMPARHNAGAGPFWCGSTSLLRVAALREVGGVAVDTITEDMHTTLKLLEKGWRTVYQHQTLAVGLAPSTPDQYLIQRRRWGMGATQIMKLERLWRKKSWMSWRNYYEYLTGTLWWFEGLATLFVLGVPITILLSGATISTASPVAYSIVFVSMMSARLWGGKRLLRGHIRFRTAFALRVYRIPIGLSCAWWLIARRTLAFQVTPKGGADQRNRGSAPRVLYAVTSLLLAICVYAGLGLDHLVPWRTTTSSSVASGLWLVAAAVVMLTGLRRIRAPRYATSRRDAPRVHFAAPVLVDEIPGRLINISVGGAAVRLPSDSTTPTGLVAVEMPGGSVVKMEVVTPSIEEHVISLKVHDDDWLSRQSLALWLFHTPAGAVPELPAGVPVAAATFVGTGPVQDEMLGKVMALESKLRGSQAAILAQDTEASEPA